MDLVWSKVSIPLLFIVQSKFNFEFIYDHNNGFQEDTSKDDHNNMSTLAKLARIAEYLIKKGPEALVHKNTKGQFPLHIACSISVKDDSLWKMAVADIAAQGNLVLIQALIQGFPNALWHPNNNNTCIIIVFFEW